VGELPVVIVGAGPVGLAAAAHARSRSLTPLVLETGSRAGAAVREWTHVRLFSPWREVVDPEAARLLTAAGWTSPDPTRYPTGGDWAEQYLQPLADVLGEQIRYDSWVTGITKLGRDLVVDDAGRDEAPLVVHVSTPDGDERILAQAVIDASGTWTRPNPMGGDGLRAAGEVDVAEHISYRVPDLGTEAGVNRYAGKHVVLAGTGASALTTLAAFGELAESAPGTRVSWLVRRPGTGNAFGGGDTDQLAARGALGQRARDAVDAGHVTTVTSFRTAAIATQADGRLLITSFAGDTVTDVDEIVAVTGFRPDLSFLSEVRLDLDPVLQAPRALAPLIDPNVHSCGTVYPHGAQQLRQPDRGVYLAGMKSYGRAPSFLVMTGFEQVRSVVAEIAGDSEAAARVELTLPDSGVCGGAGLFDEADSGSAAGCCAPARSGDLLSIGARPSP